jgi:DNA-binding beta-propeller fold protein YncE
LVKIKTMNKKLAAFLAVLIILIFIGYMIFNTFRSEGFQTNDNVRSANVFLPDSWNNISEIKSTEGSLKAVSVSPDGSVYIGGDSFISCYDKDLKLKWNIKTSYPVISLSCFNDTIFAATIDQILVLNSEGKIKNEWGPFEDNSIFTSITSNKSYIALADAGNKTVLILDKGGEVKKLIGQNDGQFIIPSPYFDVALTSDNTLYVANTGHRRIEKRTIDGKLISYFGEPGMAPEAFCGCCNPSHFILIPNGFVTAEKGLNRIKILSNSGEFVEFVSSNNNFLASLPLDLASADGKIIYAANPADSKLYLFKRK